MEVFESDADDIQTKGSRWLIKRPISIIPLMAKVFERIIYDQVFGFLMDYNFLSSHQSGFQSLHSTVTSLILEATDDWAYNFDHGNVNAMESLCHGGSFIDWK